MTRIQLLFKPLYEVIDLNEASRYMNQLLKNIASLFKNIQHQLNVKYMQYISIIIYVLKYGLCKAVDNAYTYYYFVLFKQ